MGQHYRVINIDKQQYFKMKRHDYVVHEMIDHLQEPGYKHMLKMALLSLNFSSENNAPTTRLTPSIDNSGSCSSISEEEYDEDESCDDEQSSHVSSISSYDSSSSPSLSVQSLPDQLSGSFEKLRHAPPGLLLGAWCGDRIALLGEDSTLPQTVFTSTECKEIQEFVHQKYDFNWQFPQNQLMRFLDEKYKPVLRSQFPTDRALSAWHQHLLSRQNQTHHLILNLDKMEYLDPKAFDETKTFVGQFATPMTSMNVTMTENEDIMQGLLSLLFYSTVHGEDEFEEFSKGSWAGNRLAIMEKYAVDGIADWKDISEQVKDSIKGISS
ncbi:hypothetical protein BGZ51_008271 [Haplosporangium sp. Z 767]|nr:hypothetical protein BGZ50_007518 [Haplosporangium sp. Z 11]KAF9190756.1 hypothetical protein BGZ51_008271 [Haplosporangium sp. Z 767]